MVASELEAMTTMPASDVTTAKLLSLGVHELRTPVTVAAGYIRMLLKEQAGPLSERQRKLLDEAEKSCGKLAALVADMSELAKFEAGEIALSRLADPDGAAGDPHRGTDDRATTSADADSDTSVGASHRRAHRSPRTGRSQLADNICSP